MKLHGICTLDNKIYDEIKNVEITNTFKKYLKTHLRHLYLKFRNTHKNMVLILIIYKTFG